MLQDGSNFYWQVGGLQVKNFSIKEPQRQEKPESLNSCFQKFLCSADHHPGALLPVFHTSSQWYPSIPAISHNCFPPSASLSRLGNRKERKKKENTPRLTCLSGQKRSTDTCKPLQQGKPRFAGLLISSILLPQEQVSQDSFQLGGPAPAYSSGPSAVYRNNTLVATAKNL